MRALQKKELLPLQQASKEHDEHLASITKLCHQKSSTSPAFAIDSSIRMQELGPWNVIPGELAQICIKSFDARTCHTFGDLESLHSDWHKRHTGILKPQEKRRERGLVESPCLLEGCCHCRRSQINPGLWKWVQSTRKALQHLFQPRTAALDDLMHGMVVLVWVGFLSEGQEPKLQHRFTHVPLHYLRPWRPTFLELELAGRQVADLSVLFPSIPKADTSKHDIDLDLKALYDEANKPRLRTMVEFLASLDRTLSWRVEALRLSSSPRPYHDSCGCVRVCWNDVRIESAEILTGDESDEHWLRGDEGNEADESDNNADNDNDDDDNNTPRPPVPSSNPANEEENDKGPAPGDLLMPPDLAKVWDEICEEKARAESSSTASSSNSTSTTSTSSSTTSKARGQPSQATTKVGATSSTIDHLPIPPDTGGVSSSQAKPWAKELHNHPNPTVFCVFLVLISVCVSVRVVWLLRF